MPFAGADALGVAGGLLGVLLSLSVPWAWHGLLPAAQSPRACRNAFLCHLPSLSSSLEDAGSCSARLLVDILLQKCNFRIALLRSFGI